MVEIHAPKLVFSGEFSRDDDVIAIETYVKGKKRAWKMDLVEERNPRWSDLAWNWFPEEAMVPQVESEFFS